jgi:hypothetical protein
MLALNKSLPGVPNPCRRAVRTGKINSTFSAFCGILFFGILDLDIEA